MFNLYIQLNVPIFVLFVTRACSWRAILSRALAAGREHCAEVPFVIFDFTPSSAPVRARCLPQVFYYVVCEIIVSYVIAVS